MKYLICNVVLLDEAPKIEIPEDEYVRIEEARTILFKALAVEEKYEMVIANYIDFERQIFDISADQMLRQNFNHSYLDFFEIRLKLNTRLLNLFTTICMYRDQIKQDAPKCVPDLAKTEKGLPEEQRTVDKLFRKEYGENKEYRFMEALRNYVQHCGLPVHVTSLNKGMRHGEEGTYLEYSIGLSSLRSYFEKDEVFKKKVLTELDEETDLKAATRIYMESISSVHESVRNLIAASVKSARNLMERIHCQYKAEGGNEELLASIGICRFTDEGHLLNALPLLLEQDDIRVRLQERNKQLVNLRKRYITTK